MPHQVVLDVETRGREEQRPKHSRLPAEFQNVRSQTIAGKITCGGVKQDRDEVRPPGIEQKDQSLVEGKLDVLRVGVRGQPAAKTGCEPLDRETILLVMDIGVQHVGQEVAVIFAYLGVAPGH